MASGVVLLGGYPAKQCAFRSHIENDPTVEVEAVLPEAVVLRMAAGRDFEADVIVPALIEALGERCVSIVYGDHRADKARRITETVAAMEAGVEVIIGGQLPDDFEGGRCGQPDVLIRTTTEADLAGGARAMYVPADIKHHGTLKSAKRTSVMVSGLDAGFRRVEVAGLSAATGHRVGDSYQLAHYTRMLQVMDRHPGPGLMVGAIIGTTDLGDVIGERFGFVWYDLAVPTEKTWSATAAAGHTKRSIMDVYDHDFAIRLTAATAARAGTGPVVVPFGKAECGECPWRAVCAEIAGPQDASFTISRGQVTDREWRYLHSVGCGSLDGLAAADLDDTDFVAGYVAAAAHLPTPVKRLGDLVRRARMWRNGVVFERTTTEALTVPCADVEIDFDVEWHPLDGHVYQWGARVRYGCDEATATYEHAVLSFDALDEDGARDLAEEFFCWMEKFVAEQESKGRTVAIYHWTTPETRRAIAMIGEERAQRLFAGRFLDLKAWMADRYFARDGFSLKDVAPVFGFKWQSGDAGGLTSVTKIEQARRSDDPVLAAAAQEWLLAYNEDDCAAQAAIRDGLRPCLNAAGIPAL